MDIDALGFTELFTNNKTHSAPWLDGLSVLNAEPHNRERRSTQGHKKNTCPLLLVADHRFFKHMGRGEESTTLNYLVSKAHKIELERRHVIVLVVYNRAV